MSNKPNRKKRLGQKELITKAYNESIKFVGPVDKWHDAFKRGSALIIVPAMYSGFGKDLMSAIHIRRTTSLTGECPNCGACNNVDTFLHESDCPASNDNLSEIVKHDDFTSPNYELGSRLILAAM